ncbi:preprotein translocase subunit SecA [Actinokineospora sp.]|uniref:preprotein translocase subunit SecA n=1 Tax=Actinokineospora sp. TaxID=1872133 RepID=UPI0040378A3C
MVLSRILRTGEGKTLKHLHKIKAAVNSLEREVIPLTDGQLAAKTDEFRARYAEFVKNGLNGADALDELLPEAFAVAREAAKRVLGQRHFDVQVMGGAALHLGNVAEMRTGEGKTLTGVLAAYLNALSGLGVHAVTVNDYLAKRDAEWMGRIHRFLGLSVGVILSEKAPAERRAAYECDITYGTNNEFGFDYLRDNMAWTLDDMVQRGHNYAIVDEVDSILIDEARTPLIISGPTDSTSYRWYVEFARLAPRMKGMDITVMSETKQLAEIAEASNRYHYEFDRKRRTIGVTDKGVSFVEDQLGIDNLYEAGNTPLVGYLNNSLKAKVFYEKDKEYIVRDGEVLIVDEFTGRVLAGRRYNEGMHQAIEAKEGVEIKAENQTLGTITLQNYFRLYDKLAGMTGTAQTEAAEFGATYKLGVVTIPTNRDMVRKDQADLIYKTEEAKFLAVAEDIAERHEQGQPVLVGTTNVERSEYLSKLLVRQGIRHNVLNAKHHEKESAIVAQAGHKGAVTIATNMAGRGTDIVLGGNPQHIAEEVLRARGLDPTDTPDEWRAALPGALEKAEEEVKAEKIEVMAAGGLYVLGTERHESRRIDNQLRGRSGRQGDPGESRFYLSLGDELMRRFNAVLVERVMETLGVPDDQPIEAKMVTRAIQSAQTQLERQNFEIRKNVLKYDEVMNKQRKVIYGERLRVLKGEDLQEQIGHMVSDVITAYVRGATAEGYAEDWDHEKLWTALKTLYPVGVDWEDLNDRAEHDGADMDHDFLRRELLDDAMSAYEARETEIDGKVGAGAMRELERRVMLSVLDRKWREHLYEMDYLKEGIGLRAMAQRDPLIEYQREGFDMFAAMLDALREESVGMLYSVPVEPAEPAVQLSATPTALPTVNPEVAARQAELQERQVRAQAAQQRAQAEQAAAATRADQLPPALRGRGLDGPGEQRLSYSGPSEGGGVESHSDGTTNGAPGGAGGTRRERRQAARNDAKKGGRKAPRR